MGAGKINGGVRFNLQCMNHMTQHTYAHNLGFLHRKNIENMQ